MAYTKMDDIIPLAKAIQVHNAQYSKDGADYSVTELLDPPRIILLNQRHGHKVKRHVEETLSSFIGTAIHEYVEKMLLKSDFNIEHLIKCEERLHVKIAGRKISGSYDILIDEDELNDIKTTSVWHAIFGDRDDWTIQQNIYRWMYHKTHHKIIRRLRIIAIYLDWTKYKKMGSNNQDYPSRKAMWYTLAKWPLKETETRLKRLVQNVKRFESVPDKDLPFCTDTDTWVRGGNFAVMAKGRKAALSLQATCNDAKKWIKTYLKSNFAKFSTKQLYIEKRVPERIRCEYWCSINKYCNQYLEYKQRRKQIIL